MGILEKFKKQEDILLEIKNQEAILLKELDRVLEEKKRINRSSIAKEDVLREAMINAGFKNFSYIGSAIAIKKELLEAEVYANNKNIVVSLNLKTGDLFIDGNPVK